MFPYKDPVFASVTSRWVCSDRYVIEHMNGLGCLSRESTSQFKSRNHRHSPDCPRRKRRCRGYYTFLSIHFLNIHCCDKIRDTQPQTRFRKYSPRADPSSKAPHCFHVFVCLRARGVRESVWVEHLRFGVHLLVPHHCPGIRKMI